MLGNSQEACGHEGAWCHSGCSSFDISLAGRRFAGSLTRVVCSVVKEAEVLCHLYAQLGTDLLTKLKGDFAFVLYNAKLVRALP